MIFGKSDLKLPGYDTQIPNMVYTIKGDSNDVLMLTRHTQASYAEIIDHLSKKAAAVIGLLPGIKNGEEPQLSLLEKAVLVQLPEILMYKIAAGHESVKYVLEASIPNDHLPGRNYILILSGKIPKGLGSLLRMLDGSVSPFERYDDLIKPDWKIVLAVNRFRSLPSKRKVLSKLKLRQTSSDLVEVDTLDYPIDEVIKKIADFYSGKPTRQLFQKLEDKSDRALEHAALRTIDALSRRIPSRDREIVPLLHETLIAYQKLSTTH